jgi:hypothetical protein
LIAVLQTTAGPCENFRKKVRACNLLTEFNRVAIAVFKSLLCLFALALLSLFLAAGFIEATPPGGVAWPYYIAMLLIPFAACRYAKRLSIAIVYGFACSLIFAWPVFVDSRTGLAMEYGKESPEGLLAKITLFALGVSAICAASYGLAWRAANSNNS